MTHGDDTRRIPLTDGTYALVDAADYDRLSQYTWWRRDDGYAARYYPVRQRMLMHREVLGIAHLPRSAGVTDHINGDRLDNRRANLRFVDRSTNALNRHAPRGVRLRRGKWVARIRINYHLYHLGTFSTEGEAGAIYEAALAGWIERGEVPVRLHGRRPPTKR